MIFDYISFMFFVAIGLICGYFNLFLYSMKLARDIWLWQDKLN